VLGLAGEESVPDILHATMSAAAPALDLAARVLHRDAMMLVIDKPHGIAVHAGPKGGATLDRYFDQLRFGLPNPPQLAHRLDRETSGCLVLGRHGKALAKLGKLFAGGRVEKTYIAVLRGNLPEDQGEVTLPLRKRSAVRGWWMMASPDGQPSRTGWTVLARAETMSLVALQPHTGRTHQLRVHMAEQGTPILGDRIYGGEPASAPPLHLHAWKISVPLHHDQAPVRVAAAPPAHIAATLSGLGWSVPDPYP
jgi:tRNA pseudouridine32 synthase / 23S rRNA pseudouridine746 synthase